MQPIKKHNFLDKTIDFLCFICIICIKFCAKAKFYYQKNNKQKEKRICLHLLSFRLGANNIA